ncbi:MAG: ATP-binding protein [Pseudomonadota bacterium]
MTIMGEQNSLKPHYLETELRDLIARERSTWDFLQQGSLDGIWYWDLEHPDAEWMSPEFWKLFGVDPTTKQHSPSAWQDIIFQEDLALALENFQKHCADPNHSYDQIVRYRHADGSTIWVRCRGVAIRDETGRPVRMLGAHNDITAVKRAEENARREHAKVKLANEELLAFTYGVSHDLKSPSRTALQMVQEGLMGDNGNLTQDQREMFEGAVSTLERMQVLISDLLDYGILVGQKPPEETIDFRELVQCVVEDVQDMLSESGGEVDFGDLPVISGYRSQLHMLVRNILSNAIKYRRKDVPLHIRVERVHQRSDALSIAFVDNACGIPEEQYEKIFGVFTRLHRQDEVRGSGVGLAICKRVALNHEGTLSVTSQVGLGSQFTLNIPNGRELS